ncbi:hypothetical protein QCA50_012404 [Cerrena zonata]|uniref:Methyltransferase domain-containing protein n=1 Tax=Cerrena zonata TaxID=2478898 RepID=A0AAW0FW96_9APHY
MAIEPYHLSLNNQGHPSNGGDANMPGGNDDDDDRSDTDSDITEVDAAEIPFYFTERDGRLFHSHGSSPYPLPVDAAEQNRINGQHDLLRQRMGGIYVDRGRVIEALRPSISRVRKVVDLGTGTGKWVLDMAFEFPDVMIHGIDIVPIATMHPPDNVYFEIHDINTRLRFHDASVDIVHARSVSMAVQSYPALVNEVARILRPGGLFLACEWGRCAAMENNLDPHHLTPFACRFYHAVAETLHRSRGLAPVANYLKDFIESSGRFDRVECKRIIMPIGTWHRDPSMQQLGDRFRQSLEVYVNSMQLMMIQAGRDPVGVRELVDGYVKEMYTVQGMICYFYTVQANCCN